MSSLVDVDLILRYSAEDDFITRQVNFGSGPLVHIAPEALDDGARRLTIDATDFDSPEELAVFLETVATIVRQSPIKG